jgi:hypothetical protein
VAESAPLVELERDGTAGGQEGRAREPGRAQTWVGEVAWPLMTHKYRECIIVLSINKSVKPNEEQKMLMSGFDQGITVNTSKQVFRGIW